MGIGGSASNNGVRFMSENYTARFVLDKFDNYHISHSKRKIPGKFSQRIKKIPLLKGFYTMLVANPIMPPLILIALILDFLPAAMGENEYVLISLGIISIGLFGYALSKIVYNVNTTWKFHGAEHKTIYAYENNMELTVENVRGCPRIARRCGTNLVVFAVIFYIILMILLDHSSIAFIASFVLGYELFDMEKGDKYPVIRLFFKFGNLCQQKFFTKEPSDIQIVAAIATIKKLIELENQEVK